MVQRMTMAPVTARISSRYVWTTVSRWPAQICTSTSPPVRTGSSASFANPGIAVRYRGRMALIP